jgi:hypothetical protein
MDSNYWSRDGETPLGRAMWFPRTAPPALRGTDPERDEKFESGLSSKESPTNLTGKIEPALAQNRRFESSSLQQGVRHELWTAQKKRVR